MRPQFESVKKFRVNLLHFAFVIKLTSPHKNPLHLLVSPQPARAAESLRLKRRTGRPPGRLGLPGALAGAAAPMGPGACPTNFNVCPRAGSRPRPTFRSPRPWPVWGQRRGRAAGEFRGWAPPSMGRLCAVHQTLGCQACTIQEKCSSRPALSRAMAWE